MTLRILTGGIFQETNTFQWEPTTYNDFQKGTSAIHRGPQILKLGTTGTIYGGIVTEAEKQNVELIPTTFARAVPGGRVSKHAFETLRDEIIEGIRQARKIDGILLGIHGAMAVEHEDDGEGALLRAIREAVGPDLPIVAPLDLHTNLSEEMMQLATGFVGYKEYPHIDTRETGAKAMDLLIRTIKGDLNPVMHHVKVPLIAPNQSMVTTWQSPLKSVIDRAREIEKDPSVFAATVLGGFSFSDTPHTGIAAIVVTDNDEPLAKKYASELSQLAWNLRSDFEITPVPVDDAVQEAMAAPEGSVYVLADISDSGASGTAGDGTAILDGLLRHKASNASIAQIMDSDAVQACIDAGVGNSVTLQIGGKHDSLHGDPVEVAGMVRLIHEGSFVLAGPMNSGTLASRGRTVVLEIGGRDGIEVQITEYRGHPNSLSFFRAFGIEPTERKVLVVKSAAHFRAAFGPIATKVIEVDAPGISSPRLDRFPYQNLRRPIFPLDGDFDWSPPA